MDHENVVACHHHTVRHWVYSVPNPSYIYGTIIWHLNSHYKLIRWFIVVNGAIDGFLPTIIYLKCIDNNKQKLLLIFFQTGVLRFGLPECVCFDHGGENIGVWQFMIASHNGGPSTVLIGSQSLGWSCLME